MRIFHASDSSPNAALASNIWHRNLYLPIVDLGHDVVKFDFDMRVTMRNLDWAKPPIRAYIEEHRPILEAALVEQVERAHRERPIDLFFSYFYDACCRPHVVEYIKSLGICTVNWYCNASYQLHLVDQISPAYDYCFAPEKFRFPDYRAIGAHPLYVQEAANPTFYKPIRAPERHPLTFCGQGYGERPALVRRLVEAGLPLRVWGPNWHDKDIGVHGLDLVKERLGAGIVRPPLDDDELVRSYGYSRVSLGFSAVGEDLVDRVVQTRLRDFEAPMCGAFYLVEHFDDILECFEPGKEIATYVDADDLVEQARRWLRAPEAERQAIRDNARKRSLAEHTWQKRFHDAFREIGLDPGSYRPVVE